MQIVREPAGDGATRLNEIMHVYTPPMLRVCGKLPEALVRGMIERMARHKLEEERARARRFIARRGVRPIHRSRRSATGVPAMSLAS